MTLRSMSRGLAVALLAGVLAGGPAACGSDDEPAANDDLGDDGEAVTTTTAAGAVGEPCEVVTPDELESLLGEPVGSGEPRVATVVENEVEWRPAACQWETDGGGEVTLHMTTADDFTSGAFQCPELVAVGSEVSDLPDLDDGAQWAIDDTSGKGQVRACTDATMVDVEVEVEGADEATLQAVAVGVAGPALAAG